MYRVTKRDGSITEFHIAKIGNAITRAFEAVGRQQHPQRVELLALRVTAEFEPKIRNELISVEDIQDCVERVLSEAGYSDVAKAYILYRKQREKLRNVGSTLLNYKELVDNYLRINDWRVKENSTVTYSVGGLILSNSGAITANYWLSEIYDAEIAQAHRNAELHLHDLSMLTGYCAGWSLRQLIQEGLGGVPGKISSAPASHLSTLCNQMVNFLGIMQNEWAGAQAFSSFDTYLAPFVRVDKLTQREVKQCVQSFVYGVNTPSRWGTQAPFSNITLDWTVPKDMANLPAIVGGQEQPFTYGECQKEMDMVNRAFIELMIEGDANGRGFQYPIPTYSITKDFDWGDTDRTGRLAGAEEAAGFFAQLPQIKPQAAAHRAHVVWLHVGVDIVGEIRRAVFGRHLEQELVVFRVSPVAFAQDEAHGHHEADGGWALPLYQTLSRHV